MLVSAEILIQIHSQVLRCIVTSFTIYHVCVRHLTPTMEKMVVPAELDILTLCSLVYKFLHLLTFQCGQ